MKSGTFIAFGNLDSGFERMAAAVVECAPLFPRPVIIQAGGSLSLLAGLERSCQIFGKCTFEEFSRYIGSAQVVVIHAGVGASKEAISYGRRAAMFVRKAKLNEHVDDHQQEWADALVEKGAAEVVSGAVDLARYLNAGTFELDSAHASPDFGDEELARDIQKFIMQLIEGNR